MKKRLCALLCLLLLLTAFPPTALADGEPPAPQSPPRLAVTCSRPDENTAAVTVSLENNPGIAGYDVELQLNGTVGVLADPVISLKEPWDPSISVNVINMENESIRVWGVNAENINETELFTVTFRVSQTAFDNLLFYAEGEFCDRDSSTVTAENPGGWAALYGDVMGVTFDCDSMLTMSAARVSGTMALEIRSYDSGLGKGIGYSGSARMILTCYQDGKFCGCKMQNVTVPANQSIRVEMTDVSFSASAPEGVRLKLILLDDHFVPLMSAESSIPLTPPE